MTDESRIFYSYLIDNGGIPCEAYKFSYTSSGKEFFSTQRSLNGMFRSYLLEINAEHPDLLPYQVKYDYELPRQVDAFEEEKAYKQQLERFENYLKKSSVEQRFKDLLQLRLKDTQWKFIYGSIPSDSDDVISYMQGMSTEEIYKRRLKTDKELSALFK